MASSLAAGAHLLLHQLAVRRETLLVALQVLLHHSRRHPFRIGRLAEEVEQGGPAPMVSEGC